MIKTLLKLVGKYKTAALLTPVFTALEVVMDVLIPYVTAMLIDKGINAGDIHSVYLYGLLMVVLAFMSMFFGVFSARFSSYAGSGFAANVRNAMYRHIQTFAFSDIDKYSTSGLVTRMTTDVDNLQNAFQQILRVTVRAPFRLVLSIVMCLVINIRLSIIFVVALIVLSLALSYIINYASKLFTQVFQQYDKLNLSVEENVSAIRVVKAFVREDYENQKFELAARGLYNLYVKAESMMAFTHPIMNMVVYGCIIALSWFGAHFIVSGSLTTGELTSLFTYVMSILNALMMLSMIFMRLTMSAASAKRVTEVLNEYPDIQNPKHAVTQVEDGSIEFNHVYFSYQIVKGESKEEKKARLEKMEKEGKEVDFALSNIDIKIKKGEYIGIIGGTGSGKSSMVNLVSRLYDVARGSVFVGGKDVRTYDLRTLRDAVSVVLQNNVLFSGTVIDNLRWGDPDATEEECRKACEYACADDFVCQMPDGYNSKIEQGGANLSGGQKQRLCIARALLKKPKILVLDDSTSACDTSTDARIQRSFRENLKGITKVVISQRISSVKNCDRILVLEGGKMVGYDTHENLLKNCEVYKEIFAIQNSEGSDFDEKMRA